MKSLVHPYKILNILLQVEKFMGIGRVRIYLRSKQTNFRFNRIPLTEVCWIGVVVTCDLAKVESRVRVSYLTPMG